MINSHKTSSCPCGMKQVTEQRSPASFVRPRRIPSQSDMRTVPYASGAQRMVPLLLLSTAIRSPLLFSHSTRRAQDLLLARKTRTSSCGMLLLKLACSGAHCATRVFKACPLTAHDIQACGDTVTRSRPSGLSKLSRRASPRLPLQPRQASSSRRPRTLS